MATRVGAVFGNALGCTGTTCTIPLGQTLTAMASQFCGTVSPVGYTLGILSPAGPAEVEFLREGDDIHVSCGQDGTLTVRAAATDGGSVAAQGVTQICCEPDVAVFACSEING